MSDLLPTETKVEECWGLDDCEFRYSSLCDLIDSNSGELEAGQVVYFAEQVPADTSIFFDADGLIERLNEAAYDNHGEYAEDWPGTVKQKAKDQFNAFLDKWIEKNCPATFYGVRNIKPYTLTAEDLQE